MVLYAVACLCPAVLAEEPVPKGGELDADNPAHPLAQVVDDADAKSGLKSGLPLAVIAANGEFSMGCWVALDGLGTVNPKGSKLEYEWRQTLGPPMPLSPAELKQPKLWLYLSQTGDYQVILRAKNSQGWSLPAEQRFKVLPETRYIPESEGRRVVGAGEQVLLPGSGWRQATGPKLDLREGEQGTAFRPVRAGLYVFESMRAGDAPERRGVIVPPGRDPIIGGDRRPLAKFLTRNPIGQPNKVLIIDGGLSHDPDGDEETQALKARWITPDKDRGVELIALPQLKARFKASRPGTYSVSLSVSDGRLESETETVFVKIEDAPNVPVAVEDASWQDAPDLEKEDVRYRRVSLGLWATLDRAVQMFPSRCGVALRVDADVAAPENFDQIPLSLEVMNGPLMHLIDWIARQTDTAYRRQADRSFWLIRPLGWARDEKLEPVTILVDALYRKPDGSDLLALLQPIFQPIVQSREGASLSFVDQQQELLAVLPTSACNRLKEICAALRVPAGQGLPMEEMPGAGAMQLRKTLAEKKVTLKATRQRLDYLLRDLAQSAGVAMAFDPRQFPDGLPRVDADIQNAPLRDAVRTIVDLAGFSGCSAEPPGGLWFYRGSCPYPSGELLWDHAIIRAYDLSRLLPRIDPLTGEAVAHLIQHRIYPDSWKDPGAAIFYHRLTKKLLVVHGPETQNKILEFLYDLADRGEWALGPVD